MSGTERVTVMLPAELVQGIDELERDRSRFIAEAVRHELARRLREDYLQSLDTPHSESGTLAEAGLMEWAEQLPSDDDALVDASPGKAVRWVEGRGWLEEAE